MKFRWSVAKPQDGLSARLASDLQVSPFFAQCLLNRGLNDADAITRFLQPRLKHLADPFLIPNMAAAVERLQRARERGERVVIFGDYDVDGVTATALLMETLGQLGWKADYYLPHRLEEGYGLSQDGVENCLQKFPVQLLLAVDCGSTANAAIAWLREKGVDVIVLDHHQVSNPPPAAVALVNPQLGETFRELCSAGLAFKLAHALLKQLRDMGVPGAVEYDLRRHLDLVALGTIADLVPLPGENRIFVSAGLERLNTEPRAGLVALIRVAQCLSPLGGYEVGFQLAPRLNAAGRLETADEALHLLLAREPAVAEPLACDLDTRNRERQAIERNISQEAISTVRSRFDGEKDFFIVAGHESWHVGVVGIVASRVLHEFYRPTIILGSDGELWRGSGRSIEGFDLAAALRECDDLLERHGGHAMAAGVSIRPEKVELFRTRLNDLAQASLKPEQLQPTLKIDAEIALADLTVERVVELGQLNPTGQGNPPVRLMIRGLAHQQPPQRMGKENQHVKLRVTDGQKMLEAVWWNCGDAPLPKIRFDLAFIPQINEYRGNRAVQLKVLDWRESAAQPVLGFKDVH